MRSVVDLMATLSEKIKNKGATIGDIVQLAFYTHRAMKEAQYLAARNGDVKEIMKLLLGAEQLLDKISNDQDQQRRLFRELKIRFYKAVIDGDQEKILDASQFAVSLVDSMPSIRDEVIEFIELMKETIERL